MLDQKLTITKNERVAKDSFHMTLAGDLYEPVRPGQFIDIKVPGKFLRRPISVYDSGNGRIKIIYRVAGEGTGILAGMAPGELLDVLYPLGNGFDVDKHGGSPLLIGGGIGMPPVFSLAKNLTARGIRPEVVLGFRDKASVLPLHGFTELGITPVVMIEDPEADLQIDGADARHGLITDGIEELSGKFDYAFCCGPKAMLRAVYGLVPDGQFSFEERMGCGMGACMGCAIRTRDGMKRVCKDGPVFHKDEIVWE